MPGEGLQQAQGEGGGQKPQACLSCPSPDQRVPESEYPRNVGPGCPTHPNYVECGAGMVREAAMRFLHGGTRDKAAEDATLQTLAEPS